MNTTTNLSDDELIQFILVAGFSTASTVTQLSGRGVGMDVVHNEVKQLGGFDHRGHAPWRRHQLYHPIATHAVHQSGTYGACQ